MTVRQTWTPERDEQLTTLWHAGESVEEIARQMNTTPGGIMDRRGRIGLPRRVAPGGWTDHDIDLVKAKWAEGWSASRIASLFRGRSRNAIIGKVHRLGLSDHGRVKLPKATTTRVPKPPRPVRAPSVRRQIHQPPHPGPQGRPAMIHGKATGVDFKASPEEADAKRAAFRKEGLSMVDFVTAGAGVESPNARPFVEARTGCKWPIGEPGEVRLCCNPIARGTYCEGHAAVAYVERVSPYVKKHGPQGAVENMAAWVTRFERVDHYESRKPRAKPIRTIWDEGRAA